MAGKQIVVLLGYSRAGKDTAAWFLPLYNIKFSEQVKQQVEQALGLPKFCTDSLLSDVNCKEKTLPLLKEAFKHGQWVQQNIWMPQVIRHADEILSNDEGIVFTDVRSSAERDAIINLADSHSIQINTLVLHREGIEPLESDVFVPSLIADFKYVSAFSADVLNDKAPIDLGDRVRQLYSVM